MRSQNSSPRVKRPLLFGCIAQRPESPVFVWRMKVRITMARLFPVFPYTALKGSVFIPTCFSTSARFSFFMLSGVVRIRVESTYQQSVSAKPARRRRKPLSNSSQIPQVFSLRICYLPAISESPSTKDATDHTPAPASSVNAPTSKNNTVVLRGKKYNLDTQGAEFLTDAFHISLPEAKSILEGVSPDNWPEIVSSLRESRKSIKYQVSSIKYQVSSIKYQGCHGQTGVHTRHRLEGTYGQRR